MNRRDIAEGLGIWLLLFILALLMWAIFSPRTEADIVTEIGAGVKLPSTSYLLTPDCHAALVIEPTWPKNPRGLTDVYSCGGDNPAFIGWPIAYEWESPTGVFRVRAGWFHYSNWGDGGSRRETHMDVAASAVTINWSQFRRNRRR